jgi:SAM-dependent methyltransferase
MTSVPQTNVPFRRFGRANSPTAVLRDKQLIALCEFRKKLEQNAYEFEKASCLCGEQNGRLIAEVDRYALPVRTYLCRSCGAMYTNPRMTEKSLSTFYEYDYRPIYVGDSQTLDEFYAYQVLHGNDIYKFIISDLKPLADPKVFDIGCGAGGTLVAFVKNGWHGFGSDLGSEYLKRGRAENLVLEHGGIEALSKYGKANVVILSHVLEHLGDPGGSVKAISERLLQPGYIFVEVPGIFSIHEEYYRDILLYLQNAHLYHFSLRSLTVFMQKYGFSLVKGNQNIQALFEKKMPSMFLASGREYYKVLAYINGVEIYRIMRSAIMGIIGQLLGNRLMNELVKKLRRQCG